jgi:lysophospholipase L1-like esterase
MLDSLEVIKARGSLRRFKKALETGRVVVGFAGGSITEAARSGNWPHFVINYLMRKYPGVRFVSENSAIGATGSLGALMRAEREQLLADCDIVFLEHAVNDRSGETTMRSREGFIRKLLRQERDAVLVYTFNQPMYEDMNAGKVPQSIAELEQLADHYNLPSVWMALHALKEQQAGRMRWEMLLPDGLHPGDFGSSVYAEAVNQYLENELSAPDGEPIRCAELLPEPFNARNFEHTTVIPFEKITCDGAWCEIREYASPWYRNALFSCASGASLSFDFEGRALCGTVGFGKTSGKFCYRIDGGEWQEYVGERDWWVPESNWTCSILFCDDLPEGKHHVEMVCKHAGLTHCQGTTCKIFAMMAVK